MVTDRPDRGGGLVQGALVWTLASGVLLWLLGQGISLGASGLLGALSGLTRTAASAVGATVAGGGDLAQQLGLTDSPRVLERLEDPQTVSLFASVTGLPPTEARTALAQVRSRVEAVRDNPGAGGNRGAQLPGPAQGARAAAGVEGGGGGARGGHASARGSRLSCWCSRWGYPSWGRWRGCRVCAPGARGGARRGARKQRGPGRDGPRPSRGAPRRVGRSSRRSRPKTSYHLSTPDLSNFHPHLHDWLTATSGGIIAGAIMQHRDQDTQQPVSNVA